MVHISNMSSGARVNHPSDLLSRGQAVSVKVMSIAGTRISLSMKDVDQATGQDLTPHLRIKSEAEMAEETAARFATGSNGFVKGGDNGYANRGEQRERGRQVERTFADDNRSTARRLTSPERWEIKQLIASGAASASDYPNLDQEDFATPNGEGGGADEEVDIEVREEEAPFLSGQAKRALDMSPVRIVKAPDGTLNRAAMAGGQLAKERRDMRQQQINEQADSESKDLTQAWQDPMVQPGERQFAADARSHAMSKKDKELPAWKSGTANRPVTYGKVTNMSITEQRKSLPIYQYRQALVEAIRDVSGSWLLSWST
jgi:ATP-dependent RNA helicase DHX8/PRP22